jgi:hypothetical protein
LTDFLDSLVGFDFPLPEGIVEIGMLIDEIMPNLPEFFVGYINGCLP